MSRKHRTEVNQANALHSTGPKTPEGKQRSSMNAFKHNLTGNNLILQDHEREAYARLTQAMLADTQPETELERQLVQKIIDTNFRLNRLACIENNMLNFGLLAQASENPGRLEAMAAQTRAWTDHAHSFDVLGRYEARLTRQLLQFTQELERLQALRPPKQDPKQPATSPDKPAQTSENNLDNSDMASFGRPRPTLVMSAAHPEPSLLLDPEINGSNAR